MCFEKLGYTSQMLQAFISGTFWIDCLITCKLPLENKINKKLEENKNGKEYSSNVRKKPKIKYIFLSFLTVIISIVIGKYWGLTYDKILLIDLFGIMCGCCITKIDK